MSFLVRLSKYISVSVLMEWLHQRDLLKIDTALVNREHRRIFLSLIKDFVHLIHSKLYNTNVDMSLLELYQWSLKFGLPSVVKNTVTISRYDLSKLSEVDFSSCMENVDCVVVFKSLDHSKVRSIIEGEDRVLKSVKQLTSLSMFSNNYKVLNSLSDCTLLTTLIIDYTHNSGIDFMHSIISVCRRSLMLSFIDLQDTALSSADDICSVILTTVCVYCRNLIKFKTNHALTQRVYVMFMLHSTVKHFDVIFHEFSRYARHPLLKGHKLEVLPLGCYPSSENVKLDEILALIPQMCVNLKFISLISMNQETADNVTDAPFLKIAQAVGSFITEMDFNHITNGSTIVTICSLCPNLLKFTLFNMSISNEQMSEIVQHCPLLEKLVVIYGSLARELTSNCLDLIIPYCSNLKWFVLPQDVIMSEQHVDAILLYWKQLTRILITVSHSDCLSYVYKLLKMSTLTHLSVDSLSIEKSNIILLDQHDCFESSVTHLTLNQVQVSNGNLSLLLSHCPHIVHLSMYKNIMLTSVGLHKVGPYFKKLRYLGVGYCIPLSDCMLDVVEAYCPRLQELEVFDTEISPSRMKQLQQHCINLDDSRIACRVMSEPKRSRRSKCSIC